MNKKIFLMLIGLCVGLFAWSATPVRGKYYRFANQRNSYVMSENYGNQSVICSVKNTKKYQQIWQFTSVGSLQNVYTGRYLQPQNSQSNQFKTGTASNSVFMTNTTDGNYLVMQCGGYLHCDASNSVVNWWDTAAEGDHWTFEEVSLTQEEVDSARADYKHMEELIGGADKFTTILQNYFDDAACTQLKSQYQSMSDDDLRAELATAGLPTEIQNIVIKVKNQWNSEIDPELSAKFRVRDYKIYSRAEDWRWVLNASQFNDMNNPTGVYGQDGDFIFIFVGSDIPEGTTLGIVPSVNAGDRVQYWDATSLKKGLNIVCCANNNSHYWIMYTPTNKQAKTLAEYPDLKIHVEGGDVIGYANIEGMNEDEANAEYKRVLVNANKVITNKKLDQTKVIFAVLGQYGLFNFPMETYNKVWETTPYNKGYTVNYQVYKSMKFYDDLLMRQWGIMGLMTRVANGEAENTLENVKGGDSYIPTYVNNHAPTLIAKADGNPYSTTGYTNMPGTGAVESSYNSERADFDVWCAAHESGHNNQGQINMESCMEVSNNFYSNIVTSLYGYRHSRGNTFSDNQTDSYNNVCWGWRDISIEMRMYYNLWLYYHKAGHRKDFYTRLYQLLREDPMKVNSGDWTEGPQGTLKHHHATATWIKFYKHACDAAEEDLTEYFRLWGFFIPVTKGYFGDYTSYYVTLTQKEIDDAIAEVKAKKYPENLQVMFIEDRILATERTDPWASSATGDKKYKPLNWGTFVTQAELQAQYGNLGHYTEFIAGKATTGNYMYSGCTTIKMIGEGGVGFIVYDLEGNIIYRANKLSFSLPVDLAKNGFTIKVINGDGTMSECKDVAEYGTDAQRKEALQAAITASADITKLSDATGKKVGYYSAASLADLKEAVATGKTALTNEDAANYATCTKNINNEMLEVLTNGSMQQVKKVGIYSIQSNRTTTRYLSTVAAGTSLQTTTASSNATAKWAFIPQSDGSYVMQNYGNRMMIYTNLTEEEKFSKWSVDAPTEVGATNVTLKAGKDGTFYLKTSNNCINCDPSGNIASWSEDAGSKWNITLVDEVAEYTTEDIQDLIDSTNTLVNTICTYDEQLNKQTLQITDNTAAGYLSANKVEETEANHGLDKLIDGKSNTYFMSDKTNVKKSTTYHYLQVDLGKDAGTNAVKIFYRSAYGFHTAKPTSITVTASTAANTWTTVTTLEDLPSATNKQESYTSEIIKGTKAFRYWRFQVKTTNTEDAYKYPYFALTKFDIYKVDFSVVFKPGYENTDKQLVINAKGQASQAASDIEGYTTLLSNYDTYTALNKAYKALENGIVTGIIDVDANGNATFTIDDAPIYDLQGLRVSNPQPGRLYIQNGHKVIF